MLPEMPKVGRPAKYPWDTININESFFIPNGVLESVRMMCYQKSKQRAKKYKPIAETGGIRVYRLS